MSNSLSWHPDLKTYLIDMKLDLNDCIDAVGGKQIRHFLHFCLLPFFKLNFRPNFYPKVVQKIPIHVFQKICVKIQICLKVTKLQSRKFSNPHHVPLCTNSISMHARVIQICALIFIWIFKYFEKYLLKFKGKTVIWP